MSIDDQKNHLRTVREQLPEANAVRLHRALSWMACAEQQRDNPDLRFISLWIAFNACYGVDEERHESLGERDLFQRFVHKLVKHDRDKKIYHCLWTQFSGPVRALIKNPYVFQPFWEAQRKKQDSTLTLPLPREGTNSSPWQGGGGEGVSAATGKPASINPPLPPTTSSPASKCPSYSAWCSTASTYCATSSCTAAPPTRAK